MSTINLSLILLVVVIGMYTIYRIVEMVGFFADNTSRQDECSHEWDLLVKEKCIIEESRDDTHLNTEYYVVVYKCESCGMIKEFRLK